MNSGDKMKYKFLQRSYKPHKPKPMFGFAKSFFDEIEDYLTPESEKSKKKNEKGDVKK